VESAEAEDTPQAQFGAAAALSSLIKKHIYGRDSVETNPGNSVLAREIRSPHFQHPLVQADLSEFQT
jgi:hypothetical protein